MKRGAVRKVMNSWEDAVCYVSWMASHHSGNNSREFQISDDTFCNLVFSWHEVYPKLRVFVYTGVRENRQ